MLLVPVAQFLDNLLSVEEAIKETGQQVLVGSRAEYALESEVGKQADISIFYPFHYAL